MLSLGILEILLSEQSMPNNYQLTRFPVGSIREIWAISWPLMLSLISNSIMLFVDRLVLSWHSPASLAAGTNASMSYYLFLVIPMAICAISEVLVGRLHGEGRSAELGKPVWQTVWFGLLLCIPLWSIAYFFPKYIFFGSGNEGSETLYFQILMGFAPLMCCSVAFGGFFIGIGNVKIVTICTLLANAFNAIAAYIFVFGVGIVEPMGIAGAGLATGLAQTMQALFLLICFLRPSYRRNYGTGHVTFDAKCFFDAIRIGGPAGTGHVVEIFAHCVFFRILMMAGSQQMVIASLVQSFYLLFGFVVDALSKSVGAIIANLIGGRAFDLIPKVFKSSICLHTLISLAYLGVVYFFQDHLIGLFFSGEGMLLLQDPETLSMARTAMLWMCLFFLFDGYCWILIGHLTASGDTKFIFYVSSVLNWIAYVLPVFVFVGLWGRGADAAWMIIAFYSFVNFCVYFWRYNSGLWLSKVLKGIPKSDQAAVPSLEK
jgi:MATE family multidrug resistance protein